MVEVRITVPDWEAGHAVDLVMALPLRIGDIETEYLGEAQEDRETGPQAVAASRVEEGRRA
jgi:hypothetical protein